MTTRPIGAAGLVVPHLSIGTSPLGGSVGLYGYDVERDQAVATVDAVLDSAHPFIDTSNEYSGGEAERRVGAALALRASPPAGLVLATKADPEPGAGVFDGDRVRASFRESAQRLGRDRFDVYHLHDPERFDFAAMTARGGAVDAMVALREEGLASVVGVAGGDLDEMRRYLDLGVFDILLNHSRFTLLDRSADALIDHAVAAGVTFFNAAPYASGMLAKPLAARAHYQYRSPSADIVAETTWLHEACARHDVPLAALALQFSTRDSRIASTVVGVSSPERVREVAVNDGVHIPAELWSELEERLGLRRPDGAASS